MRKHIYINNEDIEMSCIVLADSKYIEFWMGKSKTLGFKYSNNKRTRRRKKKERIN